MPLQNGLTYLKNKVEGNSAFFENIENLKSENESLKAENEELETKLRELEIIKAENETLREYSELKNQYSEYETVPAYIINRDITNLSEVFVINVGKSKGVYANMPVIASDGLVGYTISATEDTAKVQPIIDGASNVSAIMNATRDTVIAKGEAESNSELKITYIAPEASLMEGDLVKTSGIGGIYPKGILIGTLKEVIETSNITERYAIVETAVDFSKLETVLVITK